MASKYFLPKKQDLAHTMVMGRFYCDDCDEEVNEAKHFTQSDIYAWQCSNGHVTKYNAEDMVGG